MIVTKGYGSNHIISKGYGLSFWQSVWREVVKGDSKITTMITGDSPLN